MEALIDRRFKQEGDVEQVRFSNCVIFLISALTVIC